MSTLKQPGIYILQADVTNPKPDRRSKDMPNLPVWPAGMRVVFREYDPKELPGLFMIYRAGAYESDSVKGRLADDPKKQREPDPRWLAMCDGVWLREEDTAFWVLEEAHTNTSSAWLFQRLVDTGKISLNDLRRAIREDG